MFAWTLKDINVKSLHALPCQLQMLTALIAASFIVQLVVAQKEGEERQQVLNARGDCDCVPAQYYYSDSGYSGGKCFGSGKPNEYILSITCTCILIKLMLFR